MSTKLIFNHEPTHMHPVRTGLEYRVDARTKREPKRVWADVPRYKTWLGKRKDDALSRAGYKAFTQENLSNAQQAEFYKLMDNVHRLLAERSRIDHEYSKALTALAAFGPIPPEFEMQISAKVREGLKLRKLDGKPDLDQA